MPLVTRTFLLPRDRDRSREAKGQRQRRGPCRPLFGTAAAPVAKEPKKKEKFSSCQFMFLAGLAMPPLAEARLQAPHIELSEPSAHESRSDDRVGPSPRLRCGLDGRRFDQCKPQGLHRNRV